MTILRDLLTSTAGRPVKNSSSVRNSGMVRALGIIWGVVILVLCLVPAGRGGARQIELCLICGEAGAANLLLNVILYLPLGFALRLASGSLRLAIVGGLFFSLGVELVQLWIPGRFTTAGDLLANGTGAAIGGLLAVNPSRWLFPDRRLASRLTLLWSLGTTSLLAASGFLFAPAIPKGDLYVDWTPRLRGLARYRGRLLSASVDTVPLPSRRLDDPATVRALLGSGATVALRMEMGPPPRGQASVFRIVGRGRREALRIDVATSDVVVTPRFRATKLRLARPSLRFASALTEFTPPDTVSLAVRASPSGGYGLSLNGGRPAREGFTAGRAWVLLKFLRSVPGWLMAAVDVFWIAALFFPIGWWAPSRLSLSSAFVPLMALAAIPLWTPLVATPVIQYLAALVPLVLGHRLGSRGS